MTKSWTSVVFLLLSTIVLVCLGDLVSNVTQANDTTPLTYSTVIRTVNTTTTNNTTTTITTITTITTTTPANGASTPVSGTSTPVADASTPAVNTTSGPIVLPPASVSLPPATYKTVSKVSFAEWPHLKVFDGFLEEGIWMAGADKYQTMLPYFKLMPGSFDQLDKVQRQAVLDGVFFSNLKIPFHLFSAKEANDCIVGKSIHVFGDSYSRQAFIGLAEIILNDPSNMEIHNGMMREKMVANLTEELSRHLPKYTYLNPVIGICRLRDLGSCLLYTYVLIE